MQARVFGAEEALQKGLVTRVHPAWAFPSAPCLALLCYSSPCLARAVPFLHGMPRSIHAMFAAGRSGRGR